MRARGFSLIELLVVLAVIAIAITAGVLGGRSEDSQVRAEVQGMASDLLSFADRMASIANGRDMRNVSTTVAYADLPPSWKDSYAYKHPLGGTFVIAAGSAFGTANMTLRLTANSLSKTACRELYALTAARFYQVQIGATTVKSNTTAIAAPGTVQTYCNASASTSITWTLLI